MEKTIRNINVDKLITIFNQIAMIEGYDMMVNEVDPLRFFSSRDSFFNLIDKLIYHYEDLEEYEKCATLMDVKKKNGWECKKVIERKTDKHLDKS